VGTWQTWCPPAGDRLPEEAAFSQKVVGIKGVAGSLIKKRQWCLCEKREKVMVLEYTSKTSSLKTCF
jgi:hypothetical protein